MNIIVKKEIRRNGTKKDITENVISFYDAYEEKTRTTRDIGPLELYRTKELIEKYFPKPPAKVCDIGGATGVYTFWLAGKGYEAHLVDLTPKHIETANEFNAATENKLASITAGDARHLDFDNDLFDAVLIHGPLYHLVKEKDRLKVLTEARRVLKPDGVLVCVGITKYASLFYALHSGEFWNDEYYERTKRMLERDFSEDDIWYFHHPDELTREVAKSGFIDIKTIGVLGPVWMAKEFDEKWVTQEGRKRILETVRLTEDEPCLGPRTLVTARK